MPGEPRNRLGRGCRGRKLYRHEYEAVDERLALLRAVAVIELDRVRVEP